MGAGSKKESPSGHTNATTEAATTETAAKTASRTITVQGQKIDSSELFAGNREIIITHGEDSYRLRLTAQNKLILTK